MNRAERLVPWAILGALSLFVLLYLLFLVVPLPAINAVECTDDHRGDYEAPPAVQVDVHTDWRGRIVAWELPFDCTVFGYQPPSGGTSFGGNSGDWWNEY